MGVLELKKAAVTGGLASGKTTVCRFFQEFGAYVLDADAIVHQLLDSTTPLGKDLMALLGADVIVKGVFDREAIAQKVFCDAALLKKLEEYLHPAVQKEIDAHTQRASEQKYPLFIAEIPPPFRRGIRPRVRRHYCRRCTAREVYRALF